MRLLTSRERDVVRMIVAGKCIKRIGFELGTRPQTVRIKRTSILRNLDIGSEIQLGLSHPYSDGVLGSRFEESSPDATVPIALEIEPG